MTLASLPFIVGTNFKFGIDRRPAGQENDYFPARTYTEYFANGQIPVAAPGHKLHPYDNLHAPSYARVFSIPEFAEMVSSAAGNALLLPDDEGAKEFTDAMDEFGDAIIIESLIPNFERLYNETDYVLTSTRTNLRRLVALYCKTSSEEPLSLGSSQDEVFDMLWEKLGFKLKEARLGYRATSLLGRFVSIERNGPLAGVYGGETIKPSSQYNRIRTPTTESSYDFSSWGNDTETSQDS